MATRFIGKNIQRIVVRPIKNSVKYQNYQAEPSEQVAEVTETENKVEEPTISNLETVEDTSEGIDKKENKKPKKEQKNDDRG